MGSGSSKPQVEGIRYRNLLDSQADADKQTSSHPNDQEGGETIKDQNDEKNVSNSFSSKSPVNENEAKERTNGTDMDSNHEKLDKTNGGSELITEKETDERTEETGTADESKPEHSSDQEQTLNEPNERDSSNKNDKEETADNSKNSNVSKVSSETNDIVNKGSEQVLNDNVDKTKSTYKRKELANKDAKENAQKREAKSEKTTSDKRSSESTLNDNLMFYRGKMNSKPAPGYKIVEMLKWKGDFSRLESNHSYIQWLFPIPEGNGMNSSAQSLQDHEAKAIRDDRALKTKVLNAFKMMLDFYGMELHDEKSGRIERSLDWKARYAHLNKSTHNYLRITRILKSLGELGWEHLQIPWLEFLMEEAAEEQALPRLAKSSSVEYWINAIKDESKQVQFFERFEKLRAGSTTVETKENKKNGFEQLDTNNQTKGSFDQQSTNNTHVNNSKENKRSDGPSQSTEENLNF